MKIHYRFRGSYFYIILLLTLFLTINTDIASAAYPPDPTTNIPWSSSCGISNVKDIECAFNAARSEENSQLSTSLPMLSFPDQAEWDSMTGGEKALWIINQDRIDRGLMPLHGLEENVGEVAQTYAQYLIDNNWTGHYEKQEDGGRNPWERLEDNPTINDCHDFLSVAENLAYYWSSQPIALPLERAIYLWMYTDAASSWGHRHAILWYPYNDNSGPMDKEGFLGIGSASGPQPPGWDYSVKVVMNVFDPCAVWKYLKTNNIALPGIPLLLLY